MVKRIISIMFMSIISFTLMSSNIFAITKAPTPESALEKQIDSLTSKIASRVAELKLVEKRGVIGSVTDTSNTQITIKDIQDNTVFIDVDEFTKFNSSLSKTSFGISDIKKGDSLGILGLYNKESRRILARFVNVLKLPQVIRGAIVSIDDENFVIKIKTIDNKEFSTGVESSTKTLVYNNEEEILEKSGFSKIKENQPIIIIGFKDLKDPKNIEALRIIVLPDIPANPKINLSDQVLSPTPNKS